MGFYRNLEGLRATGWHTEASDCPWQRHNMRRNEALLGGAQPENLGSVVLGTLHDLS